MPKIIGIKFKERGKTYFFDPKNIEFNVGDGAIVETARGLEYTTVAISNTDVDEANVKGELKPIVRKATEKDAQVHADLVSKRLPAIRQAQEYAAKRDLNMKIVDAEFAFDGSKAIFYFTSDNRIDFRNLVKDLASSFHTRIELRQIGIRDECKMKGGLGPCGRICCCNDFLADFARVSIKMAKHQGLSLNPTKISGLCGRLMCCLTYEDEYYAETLKFMPKVNQQIATPNGNGTVVSVDMLRQTVVCRIASADDTTELREYTLGELGITPSYGCDSCKACNEADEDDDTDIIDAENSDN
ncbi:MAG: stage 0 sporulation family protein [Corallococcus sp.]|nr:stage 0 sporulation family protein [Bacillota bacterium]MCM1534189.1 stage 0 sporulation family protein [Corallococcus sp.]